MTDQETSPLHETVARIASAFASRPDASVDDIVELVARLTRQMEGTANFRPAGAAGASSQPASPAAKPALPLDQAVTKEKVYCLCCGKGFKMLKRHLGSEHGLTEDEYRVLFDLPADMPLVAPSYSARKADYAKKMGLGKYSREDA